MSLSLASRIRGEEPVKWPFEGWAKAPEEFRDKDACIAEFVASAQEMLDAYDALGDAYAKLVNGFGGQQPAAQVVMFCTMHIMYHDGQLNLVQAINGDEEMHWD